MRYDLPEAHDYSFVVPVPRFNRVDESFSRDRSFSSGFVGRNGVMEVMLLVLSLSVPE